MAQRPLKNVKIVKKPTRYMKNSKKRKDEDSLIRKENSRRTLEKLENEHRK